MVRESETITFKVLKMLGTFFAIAKWNCTRDILILYLCI